MSNTGLTREIGKQTLYAKLNGVYVRFEFNPEFTKGVPHIALYSLRDKEPCIATETGYHSYFYNPGSICEVELEKLIEQVVRSDFDWKWKEEGHKKSEIKPQLNFEWLDKNIEIIRVELEELPAIIKPIKQTTLF